MKSTKRSKIIATWSEKERRDFFVMDQITTGLAFQIRALRKKQKLSQKALGELAGGIPQNQIHRLEDPSYGKYTLKTLLRLASAFDVALVVKFVPYSKLADIVVNVSAEDLNIPKYADDKGLLPVPSAHEFSAFRAGLVRNLSVFESEGISKWQTRREKQKAKQTLGQLLSLSEAHQTKHPFTPTAFRSGYLQLTSL